jgi:FKBP-type peptidyl-prolyl cis-trans isomerase FklB
MKKVLTGLIFLSSFSAVAQVKMPELKNEVDSFSYALGINVAQNVKDQGITEINPTVIAAAFESVFKNDPGMTQEQTITILQTAMKNASTKKLRDEKEKGKAFLEANKKRKGVVTLENGLQYEVIKPGDPNGIKPTINDTVKVDYVGTLINGYEFDGSIKRGHPATFPLKGVIPGWTQILQLMNKGAEWKVYIPSELAYGDQGAGGSIPPGATLIFTIILHEVYIKK